MTENYRNIITFRANTLGELHSKIQVWQDNKRIRLMHTDINKDGGLWHCLALTGPSEVRVVNEIQ